MEIWLATGNEHKRRELAGILAGHTIKIPKDAGIAFDPDETGSTFLENALIKARALWSVVRAPVMADDSGLCADALDGRPGIFSARYGETGGRKLSDAERNALLLAEMAGKTDRRARFVCAFVVLLDEYRLFASQETLEGEIVGEQRGAGGFGYDPLLFLPDAGRTVAELSDGEKNALSHRGKAARAVAAALERLIPTGR